MTILLLNILFEMTLYLALPVFLSVSCDVHGSNYGFSEISVT